MAKLACKLCSRYDKEPLSSSPLDANCRATWREIFRIPPAEAAILKLTHLGLCPECRQETDAAPPRRAG
jgi:hypothetical protein